MMGISTLAVLALLGCDTGCEQACEEQVVGCGVSLAIHQALGVEHQEMASQAEVTRCVEWCEAGHEGESVWDGYEPPAPEVVEAWVACVEERGCTEQAAGFPDESDPAASPECWLWFETLWGSLLGC